MKQKITGGFKSKDLKPMPGGVMNINGEMPMTQ
jgi:hypothetical protein